MPPPRPPAERRPARDDGTALVGTLIGFAIMMVLLLLAVQVLLHLFAVSALSAAANQAADAVATAGGSPAAVPAAEAAARAGLGGIGAATTFDWLEVDGQQVELRVTARSPALLPLPPSYRDIERTVIVRTERFR